MNDLRMLWEIGGLVEDQNGDSVADRVNVQLDLNGDILPVGLIDFCARLGFETTSLSFDFIQRNSRYLNQLIFKRNELETNVQWNSNQLIFSFENEKKLSNLLRFIAGKWHRNLMKGKTVISKISLLKETIIIYNLSGDIVGEFPITNDFSVYNYPNQIKSLTDVWNDLGFMHKEEPNPYNEHAVAFIPSANLSSGIWKEIYYGATRIGMECTALAFPVTGEGANHALQFHFQSDSSDDATIQLDENKIYFSGEEESLKNAVAYFFREKHWSFGGHFASWEKEYQKLTHKDEVLFDLNWEDQGEVIELYEKLDELNQNKLNRELSDINIFISESKENRDAIKKNIKNEFSEANIIVRSAFKPGYFWLIEEVLPNLVKRKTSIDSIIIKCAKERTEDGLELPIRWIQELYPVDEILAEELDINSEKIIFELLDSQKDTYVVIVNDKNGSKIYKDCIHIPVSKVPYVEKGKYSYPTTSYLSVVYNDGLTIEHLIKTDRERFYIYYLHEVLPKLWSLLDKSDENSGLTKPLFDRMDIQVEMSEEELKIPVEQERISSLEALHEDLYFNTLDYFVCKGEETNGYGYSAPGGIYPFLNVIKDGSPKARIVAYKWIEKHRKKIFAKKLIFNKHQLTPVEMTYITENNDQPMVKTVIQDLKLDSIPRDVPRPKTARFKSWLCEYSYRGHPIFVYEFFNEISEDYYSAIKLSTLKPTILIETGHHANEVSSMPAVSEMMDEIVIRYPEIMKQLNLVVIPRANPDGTALHQEMIKDNPEWKHHAARYNAVGLEYSDVRYMDSIFGEANVVPKIMNRWVPDIVIDDHGIPSHEWTQPFAGYHIPPRFDMSFWIPNALIYGIARELDKKEFPAHAKVLDKITHSIQQKIKQTKIQNKNNYWRKRYTKYGNKFMPELFPIELTEDLIFYKWATKPDSESINAISRFPGWVSADLISEAADETVYGDVLELCKKSHRLFDLGAIEWIEKDKQVIKKTFNQNRIQLTRMRPLKT